MSNWSLFPPRTDELQLDEKWAFVYKKQKHCDMEDPADHHAGDCWDHVAFDPEHRLVLGVVVGKRSGTHVLQLLQQVKPILGDRVPVLVTTDAFDAYSVALPLVWPAGPLRRPRRNSPSLEPTVAAEHKPDPRLNYATVSKEYENGHVKSVRQEVVFGSPTSVAAVLERSKVSTSINTSFIERHNATTRHRNARQQRRTYRFSKDWEVHEAASYFTYYSYNFCWCVRTLKQKSRKKGAAGKPRTPAMAAGLSDHVWSLREWLSRPVIGLSC